MKNSKRNSGFAALEILTAIFVLALVGYGCFQLFHVSMEHNRVSQERTLAMRMMKNELERLKSIPLEELPDQDEQSFSTNATGTEKLHENVTRIEVDSFNGGAGGAYSIRLNVTWTALTNRPMSETLEAIRTF